MAEGTNRHDLAWTKLRAEFDKLGKGKNSELARRLNKTEGWVSRKMNLKRALTFREFVDICKALNVDPGSLFESIAADKKEMTAEEALRKLIQEEIEKSQKKIQQ